MTYSNAAKIHALHVSEEVVDTFGSVSVATAWSMARGALAASDADVAVAITGIAGPGGGTPSKPVGTVVFARAERDADGQDRGRIKNSSMRKRDREYGFRQRFARLSCSCRRAGRRVLESVGHPSQRPVEHRPCERLEQPRLEGEIDREMKVRASVGRALERPLIVQIF